MLRREFAPASKVRVVELFSRSGEAMDEQEYLLIASYVLAPYRREVPAADNVQGYLSVHIAGKFVFRILEGLLNC